MVDLGREIRLYEAKVLFYNSKAKDYPQYNLLARELGFVVELLRELKDEREEQDRRNQDEK